MRACSKLRQVSDSDLRKVVGCLPGKGLGKGGAKRHRKVLRDNIQVGLELCCR